MNCSTHKNKPAVGTCDACGAGLCQSCYEDFDIASTGEHLCPNCYRAVIVDEIEQVKPIRGMVIRELIIMIIGMQTPTPVRARLPSSGMWPIKIRSTILYSMLISWATTVGIANLKSNLPIGAVPSISLS